MDSVTSGNWVHITWRYTSSGVLDGFLNGIKTATVNYSRIIPSTGHYYSFIGAKCNTNMGSGSYFTGYIAKYRNYNINLSDATIYQNYLAERGYFSPH